MNLAIKVQSYSMRSKNMLERTITFTVVFRFKIKFENDRFCNDPCFSKKKTLFETL